MTETETHPEDDTGLNATRQNLSEPEQHVVAPQSFDAFIAMLENGQLNADMTDALRKMCTELSDFQNAFGGKCRGKLVLTLDFLLEKQVFDINADFKINLPKAKRDRTIAWGTADGRFSPQNPKQMQLFGPPKTVRTV